MSPPSARLFVALRHIPRTSLALARLDSSSAFFRSALASASASASAFRSSSFHADYPVDEEKSVYVVGKTESPYAKGKHRSNALELISKQPVIEVDGDMAVCDGGGGALGHPVVYIKLGYQADGGDGVVPCIYCGLRYRKKGGDGH